MKGFQVLPTFYWQKKEVKTSFWLFLGSLWSLSVCMCGMSLLVF